MVLWKRRKVPKRKWTHTVVRTWISSTNGVHLVLQVENFRQSLYKEVCPEPHLFNCLNVHSKAAVWHSSDLSSGWGFVLPPHPVEDHAAGCSAQGQQVFMVTCKTNVWDSNGWSPNRNVAMQTSTSGDPSVSLHTIKTAPHHQWCRLWPHFYQPSWYCSSQNLLGFDK